MSDQAGTRPPHLLDRQLDAGILALVAVVEQGDGPGQLRPLGIVGRMVVKGVVGELLHGGTVSHEPALGLRDQVEGGIGAG